VQSVKKLLMLTQRKGVKYVYPKKRAAGFVDSKCGKTIAAAERRAEMTDKEKFEGFKQKMIEENERKYGKR